MKKSLLFLMLGLLSAVSAQAQGTVTGRVTFDGTVPAIETVEVKSDVPTCGDHKEVAKILVSPTKGVANAVVKIVGAKGDLKPVPGNLDQVKCQFEPHVQAVTTGSTLVITSSDAVLHNTHAFNEDGSTAFNIAVPIVGMEVKKKLEKPGLLKLRCDAGHTWMSGYIAVFDEPFFAVTDSDGNFSISGVPPGKYELEIWQEWLGKSRQTLEVKDGANDPVVISLKEAK